VTAGEEALGKVIEEACRVLKTDGVFGFADSLFPECLHTNSQKLYGEIHREEFGALLPSAEILSSHFDALRDLTQVQYDPHIDLSELEARTEFMDIVEAKPFDKVFDFEALWRRYLSSIRTVGLSYPSVLLVSGKKM
jgi:ubiquinone/menaquinone biosynthesis C-methylase UbiE